MKKMLKYLLFTLIGIILGSIITYKVIYNPKMRYDLNNDKKVSILDLIKLRNYILENMEDNND